MYRIFIFLYPLLVRAAAPWNAKARGWVRGRRGLLETLAKDLQANSRPVAWFHCASLGEFEQGRPVMEALKNENPGAFLLLTFFSPSGLEASKSFEKADYVCYLPMDSPRNARLFLETVRPALVIFVKYEFWHYYLQELHARKVPTLLISAVFRPGQPFFRWYGGFWRKMLRSFTEVFVQDRESLQLIQNLAPARLNGDTRFDRVLAIAATPGEYPVVAAFAEGAPLIVAGSTWNEDEKELIHFVRSNAGVRFLLAPHEISKDHLQYLEKTFPGTIRYSALAAGQSLLEGARCLVVDNVGMLARLYKYATIAYVGGGFGGDGVHNVLEPAVWGKPVVFGPIYDKYREATALINAGGGFSVETTLELEKCLLRLLKEPVAAGLAARNYIERHAGATERIVRYIQEKRLLTS